MLQEILKIDFPDINYQGVADNDKIFLTGKGKIQSSRVKVADSYPDKDLREKRDSAPLHL